MKDRHSDIIIIGGGPAGLTAALYCRRAGYSVTVFEGGMPGGKLNVTLEIDNYPGAPGTEGPSLAMTMLSQAEEAGTNIVYEQVTGLSLQETLKTVTTESGSYSCHALIVASGSENRKLGVPGEDKFTGRGVSYCATCDGGFFKGMDVAVCGGGNTALEEAQYLSEICSKVYLIHRRNEFRGSAINVERTKSKPNVELVLSATVSAIEGSDRVESVRVRRADGSEISIPVSAVFIAIGSAPITSFIPEGTLALAPDGSIEVDALMRTSVPGIFAAGDVRNTPLRQIVTATADGALAAASAGKYLAEIGRA